MAVAKKTSKKQLSIKIKASTKKTVAKKSTTKKKVVAKPAVKKSIKKIKPLTRQEYLQKLYPANLSKAEKLEKVLQFAEVEIYDLIRNKLRDAFSTDPYEFDSLVEWMDSGFGKDFFDKSYLSSASIVEDILGRAIGQFEVDSWNEDHASLVKTASYVFDTDYSLFDDDHYEYIAFESIGRKSR